MVWTPSPELEKQANLLLDRQRPELVERWQKAKGQIENRAAGLGMARSGNYVESLIGAAESLVMDFDQKGADVLLRLVTQYADLTSESASWIERTVDDRIEGLCKSFADGIINHPPSARVVPDEDIKERFEQISGKAKAQAGGKIAEALGEAELARVSTPRAVSAALSDEGIDATDRRIIEALKEAVSDGASASYEQACRDLETDRISWRGTANELREALSDALHALGPDDKVIEHFGSGPDAKKPTRRQRVRYIMRSKSSTLVDSTDATIDRFESLIDTLMQRVHLAAHKDGKRDTVATKDEVEKLRDLVKVTLRDLLGV